MSTTADRGGSYEQFHVMFHKDDSKSRFALACRYRGVSMSRALAQMVEEFTQSANRDMRKSLTASAQDPAAASPSLNTSAERP